MSWIIHEIVWWVTTMYQTVCDLLIRGITINKYENTKEFFFMKGIDYKPIMDRFRSNFWDLYLIATIWVNIGLFGCSPLLVFELLLEVLNKSIKSHSSRSLVNEFLLVIITIYIYEVAVYGRMNNLMNMC